MTMNLSYMNNPLSSHIYENQSEFLQNYYTTPINSTPTTQDNECNKHYKTTQSKCQNKMLKYKPHLSEYTKRTTQRKTSGQYHFS